MPGNEIRLQTVTMERFLSFMWPPAMQISVGTKVFT